MPTRLVFTGKQQVHLEEFETPPVGEHQARVRSLYSLMSTGTENIIFNRLFEPNSHWDNWVSYPFYPGYAAVGIVEEIGSEVQNHQVGDLVALRGHHASQHVLGAAHCYPVPQGLDVKAAPWFALAKIAFIGARAADYSLGDSVLIIGAGPIGQMSTRWASAAGAETIIVVDSMTPRLELARQGGATHLLPHGIEDAHEAIQSAMNGELPRVVIDSTGNAQVFAQALQLARPRGRVVVLGDTGTPSGQHLTPDVVTRGLTIVGAHDGHNDAQWHDGSVNRLFGNLALSGRFSIENLNTHEFQPQDCVDAYATVNTRRGETMGVLFDWTHS